MAPVPALLLAWLRTQVDEMLTLLEELVLAESPTHDPAAQDLVFALLGHQLRALGMRTLRVRGQQTGGWLLARSPHRRRPTQLVLGHTDTVWPQGTIRSRPFRLQSGRAYGPGVYDMKAGLVQLVFALRALQALGLEPAVAPMVFLNSDEELGSPESTAQIYRLARHVRRAYVLEPSLGPEGKLKTARKAVARYDIRLVGRESHAGLHPERGASAVHALGPLIADLLALDARDTTGVTLNVGRVAGGSRPNVVAGEATAVVDVRAPTLRDVTRVDTAIRALRARIPGVSLELEGGFSRAPMEAGSSAHLWEAARSIAGTLGFPLDHGAAGGASDGNTTARFAPTLDGLGAVGDGAHEAIEHVVVDTLAERAALLAALLLLPP